MKTTKLLLVAALCAGFATLSFAGPGAQFSTEQAQNRKAAQIKAAAKAQPAPTQVAACANCGCAGMKKS